MRFEPLGDQAVMAYCDDEAHATHVARRVRAAAPAWLVDVVQAYISVAIYYEQADVDCFQVSDWLAGVFADKIAVIDGELRWTYAQLYERCTRLAGALRAAGVQSGERVAVLAPNTHVLLESHYGVPFAGAVLVAMNMRLTAADLTYIIDHSDAVRLFDTATRIERDDRLVEQCGQRGNA